MKDSYFLPPERKEKSTIFIEKQRLMEKQNLESIFGLLPHLLLVLNEERQMVFCNQSLLNFLSQRDYEEILGLRPGEIFHCIHSDEMEAGCGTSSSCQYCGAAIALDQAIQTQKPTEHECNILCKKNHGHTKQFILKIYVYPYNIENQRIYLFFLEDISQHKRLEQLELIFLHDLGNLVTALSGHITTFPETGLNYEQVNYLKSMRNLDQFIINEIQAQKVLANFKKREITPNYQTISVNPFIQDIKTFLEAQMKVKGIQIQLHSKNQNLEFVSDKIILRRVLINLLKNAIEASRLEEKVTIGWQLQEKTIQFWIHNTLSIPPDIQAHLFQFGVSKKGKGRGIGLYSTKFLVEEPLEGKIRYKSNPEHGTTFYVSLPQP